MASRLVKRYNSGKEDITPRSLLNNESGITLLMRDYEAVIKENEKLKQQNQKIIDSSSSLKTSASYNIFTILFNLIGTVMIGFGVNLITSSLTFEWKNYLVLILGIIVYFLSALMVVRHDTIVTCWNKMVEKLVSE